MAARDRVGGGIFFTAANERLDFVQSAKFERVLQIEPADTRYIEFRHAASFKYVNKRQLIFCFLVDLFSNIIRPRCKK